MVGTGQRGIAGPSEREGYELLITTDQNMRYQQNLSRGSMAIIVLRSNRWPYVQLRIEDIRAAINGMQPGELKEVSIPEGEG